MDHLLPRYLNAPEINSGWKSHEQCQTPNPNSLGEEVEKEHLHYIEITFLKSLIIIFPLVIIIALVTGFFASKSITLQDGGPQKDPSIAGRVKNILSENPLIDGHNDLAILIRYVYRNRINDAEFSSAFEETGLPYHVDLPRLRAGRMGGAFWSAFVPCPHNGNDFSDENYAKPVSQTLSQLDLIRRLTNKYPTVFQPPMRNSSEASALFRKDHRLISPLAIEGLHQIGNSISTLRLYNAMNVKYATLTHNCHNAFADAALTSNASGNTIAGPPYWGGISPRGKELVREMNRIGMIVDLAHVSKDTMLDVLGANEWAGSEAPVIFSHSSAYALCPHPRNVPDDVLDLVKRTRSLVMVNFSPDFISCVSSDSSSGLPDFFPTNATLHQVARHIMYIGNMIGFDHVGIGSDFDGVFTTPRGLEDVSKFPDLIAEILRLGVDDDDAAKIAGQNLLRVWSEVDKKALEMRQRGVKPLEDNLEKLQF